MAIQKKEVDYAKEIGDVGMAMVELLSEIKAKKSVSEILAGTLPKLMDAVNGIDQLDDELKANRKAAVATMGYHTGEMVDALLPAQSA